MGYNGLGLFHNIKFQWFFWRKIMGPHFLFFSAKEMILCRNTGSSRLLPVCCDWCKFVFVINNYVFFQTYMPFWPVTMLFVGHCTYYVLFSIYETNNVFRNASFLASFLWKSCLLGISRPSHQRINKIMNAFWQLNVPFQNNASVEIHAEMPYNLFYSVRGTGKAMWGINHQN